MKKREIIVPVKYFDGDVLLYRVMATEEQIKKIEESNMGYRAGGDDEDFFEIFGANISEIGELIDVPGHIFRD